MVNDDVYKSAVQGRRDFRSALRHEREINRKLRDALVAVRSKGIIAGAAFVRKNADGAERCTEVLDIIDNALACQYGNRRMVSLPRSAKEKLADEFDCDLYRLICRAETHHEVEKFPRLKAEWWKVVTALRSARPSVRAMMAVQDLKEKA